MFVSTGIDKVIFNNVKADSRVMNEALEEGMTAKVHIDVNGTILDTILSTTNISNLFQCRLNL